MTNSADASALARAYVLAHLDDDEQLTWHRYRAACEPHGLDSGPLTQVLNDLELEGVLTFALGDRIRRPQPGDPGQHPLEVVAADVLTLDWTPRTMDRADAPRQGRLVDPRGLRRPRRPTPAR